MSMRPNDDWLKHLGIRYPIVQAPMGGGTSTPALSIAVANAGAMACLGSAYDAPEKIESDIRTVRAATAYPLCVNLFIPVPEPAQPWSLAPMLAVLARIYGELGIEAPSGSAAPAFSFEQQLDVVLSHDVPIFSFTFGMLEPKYVEALHSRKVFVMGTATTLEEAVCLEAAGVDAIILQGSEAGAHRGNFLAAPSPHVGLFALIPQVAARCKRPLIASGGIMDGRGISAAFALGASAVQMGTAFLLCDESGATEAYKQAVLAAKPEDTQITRAFSGREARGIRNHFIEEIERAGVPIPHFPVQNNLTRPLRKFAAEHGRAEYLSLWSGQNGSCGRRLPAAQLVQALVREAGL